MPDNIYPDLSNDRFDIQYARLLGLSSDLQASAIISGSDSPPPPIETPDDDTTGLMRFGAPAEDDEAGENRSFDLGAGFSFALTQLGNNHFLVDPPNGLYQLGAVPVPGSDSGLSYTYLEIDDVDKKITLQAPEGIVLPGYGYGNHAGTAAYNLAVDAGGNLIEVSATGGGYTNLTQFVDQNNWKVFYSDGSGDVQELSIGASGDVLTSNGTSAAPSWQTPSAGSGTVNSGLQYKAAYYITNPSGTVIDDWAGCNFGQTNLNTQIVCQAATEVGMEIKAAGVQTANLLNISSISGTGDLVRVLSDGTTLIGTTSPADPIAGNSKFKVVAGPQIMSFTDLGGLGSGLISISNGVVVGLIGHTNTAAGGFITGSFSAHPFTFRTNNNNVANFSTVGDFAIGNGTTAAAVRLHVVNDNVNVGSITRVFRGTHTVQGTPVVGVGVGEEWEVETSVGNNEVGAAVDIVTTNVGSGTEAFDYVIKLMAGGATAAEKLRVISTGELKIDLLNQDDTETKVVVWNSTDKILEWRDAATFGGGSDTNFAEDDLTATGDRSHTFGAHTAEITFNSLAGDSGLKLTSTSTAAASNAQKLLEVALSGANANNDQTTYAVYITNSHSGSGATNIGVYSQAAGTAVWGESSSGFGVLGRTTGAGAYGVGGYNTTNGAGVYGEGTTHGVHGFSTNGNAVYGQGNNGYGVYGLALSGISMGAEMNHSIGDSVETVLNLRRNASSAVGAGIGGRILMEAETSTTANTQAAEFIWKWTVETHASRTSQAIITGVNSASTVNMMVLGAEGYVQLRPITATAASAITPAEGMLVMVSSTNGTFGTIGIYCYQNGAWAAL